MEWIGRHKRTRHVYGNLRSVLEEADQLVSFPCLERRARHFVCVLKDVGTNTSFRTRATGAEPGL